MPPLGGGRGSRQSTAIPFGAEKLEWCGYPTVKKIEDIFIRFGTMHECDRHTHTHTPILHDCIGRTYAWHRMAKLVVLSDVHSFSKLPSEFCVNLALTAITQTSSVNLPCIKNLAQTYTMKIQQTLLDFLHRVSKSMPNSVTFLIFKFHKVV